MAMIQVQHIPADVFNSLSPIERAVIKVLEKRGDVVILKKDDPDPGRKSRSVQELHP